MRHKIVKKARIKRLIAESNEIKFLEGEDREKAEKLFDQRINYWKALDDLKKTEENKNGNN